MAAAVLESVAVPRSSALQRAQPSARTAMAPVSSLPGARGAGLLPECKGLRLARRTLRAASLAAPSRRAARRGVVCEAQDIAVEVPDVTKATWQSYVIESETPVLVEFWAPWCGPCRMILPTIGELSKEYAGKLKCYKVNTDECPDIATQFGIRSIPTIMIFKNGEKKDAIIGAVPKSSLTTFVEKFL